MPDIIPRASASLRADGLLSKAWCQAIMRRRTRGRAVFLTALLLLLLAAPFSAPTVAADGRDASVSLYSDSMGKEASPGTPAEYTITVYNDGDVDITVQLSTQEETGGCQGWSSSIEQVQSQPIEPSSSEQVTLTVNVTEGEQTSDECDTTVLATASNAEPGSPGPPAQADVTVTTTKTEGSGNAVYGVELSASTTTQTYDGEDTVEWIVTVKNTGQAQAQISIEMTDSASCRSDGLTASVDPQTMTLQSDDDEQVTVSVPVPNGDQTEAGSHCFIVHATVTNDPNQQNQAQDNLSLTLNIPELHECDSSLASDSMSLDPGESASNSFNLDNTGNSDWTVTFGTNGQKASWVDSSTSSRLLPYNNGNGEASFSFTVTADDSLPANEQTVIKIQALDGNSLRCESTLTVVVGQSHGATASLSSQTLSRVDPGSSDSTSLTITNTGNGAETYSVGTSGAPAGWGVSVEDSSVTLQGKHAPQNERQISMYVSVYVPEDALADEEVTVTITVSDSSGGTTYATVELSVTVAERHEMSVTVLSVDQTGRSDSIIQFPFTVDNTGNVQDSFRLRACDPSQPSGCISPPWPTRFVDGTGQEIQNLVIGSGGSGTAYLEISVPGENEAGEGDYLQVNIKVTVVDAPSVDHQQMVTARVSNYEYMMQLVLANPQGAPDATSAVLPPGGSITFSMLISDVGTSPYIENALFTSNGMESTISRALEIEGAAFQFAGLPFEVSDDSMVYQVNVTLTVLEGVANGADGIVHICASSMRNTASPSCVSVSMTVQTLHQLSIDVEGGPIHNTIHPAFADYIVIINNDGNVDETVVVTTTDGLRGWTIDLNETEVDIAAGESASVRVRVKPPHEMSVDDSFEFTLTVAPKGEPVAAQPIDLTVNARMDNNLFGLTDSVIDIISYVTLAIIGILIIVTLLNNRRQSETWHEEEEFVEEVEPDED